MGKDQARQVAVVALDSQLILLVLPPIRLEYYSILSDASQGYGT